MAQSASRDGANGYEQYFGFHQTPFSLAPDVRFRFQSGSHAAALAQVRYALERREPVVVVTGDIGTGKTLLCRTVIEQLDSKTFLSIINDPLLSRDDLLKRMLEDFGMLSKDRASATPVSRHDLIHALQEFLATVLRLKAHAAVVIDEAQHVQPDVLEQIRLLSNIQDERGTALQIILVGQTDLEPLLSRPELRQLRQRVSRRVRLDALSQDEVALYIRHRLAVARQRPVPSGFPEALAREFTEWERAHADTTFTTPAAQAVAQESGGIPRVVNLICDRALESRGTRKDREPSIQRRLRRRCGRSDSQRKPRARPQSRRRHHRSRRPRRVWKPPLQRSSRRRRLPRRPSCQSWRGPNRRGSPSPLSTGQRSHHVRRRPCLSRCRNRRPRQCRKARSLAPFRGATSRSSLPSGSGSLHVTPQPRPPMRGCRESMRRKPGFRL